MAEQGVDADGYKTAQTKNEPRDDSGREVGKREVAARCPGEEGAERQKGEVERAAYYEKLRLPAELDYMQVTARSIEARQALTRHRPETLGQASRITGITPAAISLLMVHLKKGGFKDFALNPAQAEGEVAA